MDPPARYGDFPDHDARGWGRGGVSYSLEQLSLSVSAQMLFVLFSKSKECSLAIIWLSDQICEMIIHGGNLSHYLIKTVYLCLCFFIVLH